MMASAKPDCTTAADCSYNGHCVASGTCLCLSQWRGPRCETLNLLPANKNAGYQSPHGKPTNKTSSWGGSILFDDSDGKWHMFAAEMAAECGIDYWEPNSRVVHAVSDAADGPFTYSATVMQPFAHEPNAVRAPDGSWVIYMTLRHPSGPLFNCSGHKAMVAKRTRSMPPRGPPPPRHTYMVHAASPYGPWSSPKLVLRANTSIWDNRTVLIDTNLAVAILPDHSVVGIWRKCENPRGTVCEAQCCTFPHLLTATDWRRPSTYHPHSDTRIFGGVKAYGAEDPMLWLQPRATNEAPGRAGEAQGRTGVHASYAGPADGLTRGQWTRGQPPEEPPPDVHAPLPPIVHAILHDEQGPERCTAIGRHAFSDDLGATWTYATDDAYNGSVAWTLSSGGGRA